MLKSGTVMATLPASDLERAKQWYSDKLGMEPDDKSSDGGYLYNCADGTRFAIFPSSGAATGSHTQMGFDIKDFDALLSDLRSRGVKFEEYDLPGFKTVDGVADINGKRGVWIKDSEGNLLAIGEFTA